MSFPSETIADILREMRESMPQKMEGFKNGELVVLNTAKLADQIEAAVKALEEELAKLKGGSNADE